MTGPCSSEWDLLGVWEGLQLTGICLFNRWSHDSKYVARMSENLLSVYDVPVSRETSPSCPI